jgi:ferric-dicitrate binding protein FerR (iron transport regulator)
MYKELNNYFAGRMTRVEKVVFFRQLEADERLKAEFVRRQNMMALSGLQRRDDDERLAWEKFYALKRTANIRRLRRIAWTVSKYAAVIALAVLVGYMTKRSPTTLPPATYTCIEAPAGQRASMTLADGTKIWLQPRSSLKLSDRFNKQDRIIELNGEGYFSVEKNEELPFVVQTRQYNITATGTAFSVFAYAESPLFETCLTEGSVEIADKTNETATVRLRPNEKADNFHGRLKKNDVGHAQVQMAKNGIFSFENMPLGEITQRLELWYDVKITIANPKTAGYLFSGKFRQTDDIKNIMRAIKETGKFSYKFRNEHLIEIK